MSTALAVDPALPRRRLDVHEYHRMAEVGILSEHDRVELIDGEIIETTPVGDAHVDLVIVLTGRLAAALGQRAAVSVQNPLRLTDRTEPEPDLVVLRPERRRGVPLAEDALLVIEVADSSLAYDRDTKLPRLAASGIPEAWLVDVAGGTLVRYRTPGEGGYRERDVPDLSAPLPLHALPGARVDLGGLFRAPRPGRALRSVGDLATRLARASLRRTLRPGRLPPWRPPPKRFPAG